MVQQFTEEHIYQIKGLPNPTGTLNNEYSSTRDAINFYFR